jgi:hypothetical protein
MAWARAGSGLSPRNGKRNVKHLCGQRAKPCLYDTTLPVMAMVMNERPWNAPENQIRALRPVAARAILTALSKASARSKKARSKRFRA